MIIKNTATQEQRRLYRKVELNGPFIEIKSQLWFITNPDDSEEEIDKAPENVVAALNRCYEQA